MNYEYILREIKLSKLTDTPMSDEASKLVKFWNDLWCDMKVQIDSDKGKIECWKDGYDYYYFYQEDKNARLWCDFDRVWIFFHINLPINYDETQEIIQTMVGKTLNCVVNIPEEEWVYLQKRMNKTLNCVMNPPKYNINGTGIKVMNKTSNC